jgi:ketosteroid isomerase-like protein
MSGESRADAATISLADRFNAALYKGDIGAVTALLGPTFQLWHNFSGKTYDRSETIAFLRREFAASMRGLRYESIRRLVTPQGYVEQHLASAYLPSGVRGSGIEACVIVRISNGQFDRIDEYLDSVGLPEDVRTSGRAAPDVSSHIEANKTIARQFAAALESGREQDFSSLLAKHATWKVPQLVEVLDRAQSIAALKRMVDGANVRVLEETGITAEGDRVAMQWKYRMELKDGSTYENDYHNLFVIKDRKIEFMQSYMDTAYAHASSQVSKLIDDAMKDQSSGN